MEVKKNQRCSEKEGEIKMNRGEEGEMKEAEERQAFVARNGLAHITLRCGFGKAPISLLCYIYYKHLRAHIHTHTLLHDGTVKTDPHLNRHGIPHHNSGSSQERWKSLIAPSLSF